MRAANVIILNPHNSLLKNQITESLSKLNSINYISIDSSITDYSQISIRPALILLILDKCHDEKSRISNLGNLAQAFPSTPIISIFGDKTLCKNCLDCRKFAWGFFRTPLSSQDIEFIVSWYIDDKKNTDESVEFDLKKYSLPEIFIGGSPPVEKLKQRIIKVAPLNVTVLLQGDTGTGKELSAKLIHYLSKRSAGPFVAVNCGAIPPELFENELFGHNKGAYTHAETSEKGLIQSAHTGTLFLDEVESLPLSSQVKLLRFIEEKKYKPLGQSSFISSDVRIIAATNKDLAGLVKKAGFRDDLFYRLTIANIYLPPLRERENDIPILANHFLDRYSKLYSKDIKGFSPNAMMHLIHYPWPGNIREMENLIQETVIFSSNKWIEAADFNFMKEEENNFTLDSFQDAQKRNMEKFQKDYLKKLLSVFNGNVSKASRFAKADRRGFYRLIKKYNINPDMYRSGN